MIPNFRTWDIKNKYYLGDMSGYDLYFQDGEIYEKEEYSYCYQLCTRMLHVTDQYIVEMGSGIPDIEGNEIFEGDIVRHTHTYKYSNGITREFSSDREVHFSINYGAWLMGEYDRLTPKNIKKYSIKKVGHIHE